MTTVVVEQQNGIYKGFYCMGHADYAKKRLFGKEPDILCSAISAVTFHTINGITEIVGDEISVTENEETGFIKCEFPSQLQFGSKLLMDCFIQTIQELSKQYGEKYLTITIKEV